MRLLFSDFSGGLTRRNKPYELGKDIQPPEHQIGAVLDSPAAQTYTRAK
jgi:hypothetical protein